MPRPPSLFVFGAGAAFALVALGACSSGETERSSSGSTPEPPLENPAAPALPTSSQQAIHLDDPSAVPGPPSNRAQAPLDHFEGALTELRAGTRKEHVRILFMGDSHAQADYLPGALRTALQEQYGSGGPGFLHAGLRATRHDQVSIAVEGLWRTEPKRPSLTQKTSDGMFGLGGIMVVGKSDPLRTTLALKQDSSFATLRWDVCFRPSADTDVLSASGAGLAPVRLTGPPGVHHQKLTTTPPHEITLRVERGSPALCGVIAEAPPEPPGVVLSTLGIVGAAYATPLAWDFSHWKREVLRHPPDLVILEYGTNEATDEGNPPQKYADHLAQLIERVRRVAPQASCLVISPTDRSDRENRVAQLHPAYESVARRRGCHFWDLYALMGGRGSMRRLQKQDPPLAAEDGVHFTEAGYRHFGAHLADELMPR